MIPYIVCAALSCVFAHVGANTDIRIGKQETKIFNRLFFALSIFLPCFLAAIRDRSVGTDVNMYGYNLYIAAQSEDFLEFVLGHRSEPLYNVIVYLISQFHNIYIYFFIIEFLVVYPVFLFIRRYVNRRYIGLSFFLFYCLLYGFSLNLMRQCISMAIIMWASKYIFEKKFKKYAMVVIVCFFIHYSSIIALALYPIAQMNLDSTTEQVGFLKKYSKITQPLLIILLLVMVGYTGSIVEYISEMFNDRYSTFVNGLSSTYTFDFVYIILIGGILLALFSCLKSIEEYDFGDGLLKCLFYFVLMGAILYQFRAVFAQLLRISLYFTNYLIILIPLALDKLRRSKYAYYIMSYMIVIVAMVLFVYYYYIIKSWNGVVPYSSSFLGI